MVLPHTQAEHVRKKIRMLVASEYFSQIARNQCLPFSQENSPQNTIHIDG